MSYTRIYAVYGRLPPCANSSRLEERKNRVKALKLERGRTSDKPEDSVTYNDSDSEKESYAARQESLYTSYNFVDYVRYREISKGQAKSVNKHHGSRHILTHEMFKETPIMFGNINKNFCSQWLSDRQIIFGTKCNKLMVYDVAAHSLDQIPLLVGRRYPMGPPVRPRGIRSVQINPSRTLLATSAQNTGEIAIYKLPTFDPVCVGEKAHKEWVFGMCWVDDQFLVSGSMHTRRPIANWIYHTYQHMSAVSVIQYKNIQNTRALIFNKVSDEVAALSMNDKIYFWCALSFQPKCSWNLSSSAQNMCIAVQGNGLYGIGCRSYTILLDTRTRQTIKIASPYPGCGYQCASFQGYILTMGTELGLLMFHDLTAGKFLESSINSSRTVVLKARTGVVVIMLKMYYNSWFTLARGSNHLTRTSKKK